MMPLAHARETHVCHRPGCGKPVPPKMLACRKDWFALPRSIRAAIWAGYRPGQEISKKPSGAYLEAFHAARDFWLTHP